MSSGDLAAVLLDISLGKADRLGDSMTPFLSIFGDPNETAELVQTGERDRNHRLARGEVFVKLQRISLFAVLSYPVGHDCDVKSAQIVGNIVRLLIAEQVDIDLKLGETYFPEYSEDAD